MNKSFSHVEVTETQGLNYVELQEDTLAIFVCSYSSFANNHNGTSQLEYLVYLKKIA